jgi:c-di-GMP-binding flagellar brake protein YcgR
MPVPTPAEMPMPIDSLRSSTANLDEFRIDAGAEVLALLRQIQQQRSRVSLGTPEGITLHAPLIEVDPGLGGLCFSVRGNEPELEALQHSDEVLGLAYLDSIRLEFELGRLLLVKGAGEATLRAPVPPLLYRFQRRQAFRVQPLGSNYPRVQLRHPHSPELALQLRVLDVSITGLALLLPPGTPEIAAGETLARVQVELERDSHFEATLKLQHLSSGGPGTDGIRLGCAFTAMPDGAERALQSFIDLTQKRQRLMAKKA